MSEHIDRLCGELRIKLHGIDRRLEALKANAMATSEKSQHAVESQLDRVEQRIYDNRIRRRGGERPRESLVRREEGRLRCWSRQLEGEPPGTPAQHPG